MSAAFAELSAIDQSSDVRVDGSGNERSGWSSTGAVNSTELAISAAAWIASTVKADGTVPYIVTPPCTDHVLYVGIPRGQHHAPRVQLHVCSSKKKRGWGIRLCHGFSFFSSSY